MGLVWGKGHKDHIPKTSSDIERENSHKAKRIADYETGFKKKWGAKY